MILLKVCIRGITLKLPTFSLEKSTDLNRGLYEKMESLLLSAAEGRKVIRFTGYCGSFWRWLREIRVVYRIIA